MGVMGRDGEGCMDRASHLSSILLSRITCDEAMLQHVWEFDYFKIAIRIMNGMGQLGVLFSLDVFISAQFFLNKIISPTVAQIVVAMKFAFFDTGIVREPEISRLRK
jgi:hypothetical protein